MDRKRGKCTCSVCGKEKSLSELIRVNTLKDSLKDTIKKEIPELNNDSLICTEDLNHYRKEHIDEILEFEKGELTSIENEVVNSVKDEILLSKNVDKQFDSTLTAGEAIADKVAEFGGSWKFIIIFGIILISWIFINTVVLLKKPFDPYPYILLNLMLSCIAALQAPVIMMSQNRQESKDRLRAENDYQVNLKAEIEIRHLNEKIDFLTHQMLVLLETQEMQMDSIDDVINELDNK